MVSSSLLAKEFVRLSSFGVSLVRQFRLCVTICSLLLEVLSVHSALLEKMSVLSSLLERVSALNECSLFSRIDDVELVLMHFKPV